MSTWWFFAGCAPDLPPGWEDAVPVDDLAQSACAGGSSDAGVASAVSGDLDADPLRLLATAVPFRCDQEVEGFWRQRGGTVEVLVQPADMHPGTVARCDCRYDLDIEVGSPAPAADEAVVWRRWDAKNDPNPVVEVGRVLRGPCDDRTGGALVTIDVNGETFTSWSVADAFVDGALAGLDADGTTFPMFGQVQLGTECDPQWSWHVDAADMSWVEMAIELCDGTPSTVAADVAAWIDQVGAWCPWAGRPIAVEDRR